MHNEKHPLSDQVITLKSPDPTLDGKKFTIEDWWDHKMGSSWQTANGNPICNYYATHSGPTIPLDDEVVYGHTNGKSYIVHESELVKESVSV